MSINESQEFEAINQKVKERTESVEEIRQNAADTYQEVKARRKAKALASIIAVVVVAGAFMAGVWGLEMIGWVNHTFRVVLMCVSGTVAMFKAGYFWHEFKK